MKRWMVCLALACLWSIPAGAQQPENTKPGPELAVLKKQVGTWDAEMDMQGTKSKGTMVWKEGPGGLWFISDFTGDLGGLKFEGHGVNGYDPAKKKYVGTWTDSMTPSITPIEGTYDAGTKTMTETMSMVGPDGKPAKAENVTVYKGDDEMVWTMSAVLPDGTKQHQMTITYKRRK